MRFRDVQEEEEKYSNAVGDLVSWLSPELEKYEQERCYGVPMNLR